MQKLLQDISKRVLLLNEYDFTEEQKQTKWLGVEPATDDEIEVAEKLLQIGLPEDYIQFLKITNGFTQCVRTGVTFLPINKVDYLINVDEDLVEIWHNHDVLNNTGQALSSSLLIGGLNEEQYFLLIPPNGKNKKWRYWKFASWIPGEHEFKSLKDYFRSELTFLKEETKGLKKTKPKFIVDYSLRDHVFNSDWENAYQTAFRFLMDKRHYFYFDSEIDLLKLLLLSASKLNNFEKLEKNLQSFKEINNEYDWLNKLIMQYEEATKNKLSHISDLQTNNFIFQGNNVNLEQIEEQTKTCRPELLKPKNVQEKVDYQLYFLFEHGNAKAFIDLYEQYLDSPYSDGHIKAAIVYATLDQLSESQGAIERYFKNAFDYRPLEPFLDNVLINLMTEEFSKNLLLKFKEKL